MKTVQILIGWKTSTLSAKFAQVSAPVPILEPLLHNSHTRPPKLHHFHPLPSARSCA